MANKHSPRELMDELHELQTCRRAVTQLVTPGGDLSLVNRDNLTILLSLLDRDTERVLGNFEQVLRSE